MALRSLLPSIAALVSRWYPVRWRQRCWAHLLRDIEAMIGRGGRSQDIGEALQSHVRQMVHWWHRVRGGTLKRPSFRSSMSPLRREVAQLLEAGGTCGNPKTEGVCREILTLRLALWTFVHLEGVEPTNNAAETNAVAYVAPVHHRILCRYALPPFQMAS